MFQRHKAVAILGIVQHGMALAESAALTILATEPDSIAFACQSSKSQRLRPRPIEWVPAGSHLPARLQEPLNLRMRVEVLRQLRLRFEPGGKFLPCDTGRDSLVLRLRSIFICFPDATRLGRSRRRFSGLRFG